MLPFFRVSGIVSTLLRLAVIILVVGFIIQQLTDVSVIGSIIPYDLFKVIP